MVGTRIGASKAQVTGAKTELAVCTTTIEHHLPSVINSTITESNLTEIQAAIAKASRQIERIEKHLKSWEGAATTKEEQEEYDAAYTETTTIVEEAREAAAAASTHVVLHLDRQQRAAQHESSSRIADQTIEATRSVIESLAALTPNRTSAPTEPAPRIIIAPAAEQIEVPAFNNKRSSWKIFKEGISAVVDTDRYTEAQKLFKLKKKLSGNALEMIEGISTSQSTCFRTAMDILSNFYDDTNEIVRELLNKWEKLPSTQTVAEVKKVLVTSTRIIRQLSNESVNTETEAYAHHFTRLMPQWIMRSIWKKHRHPTLQQLLKEVSEVVKDEEYFAILYPKTGKGNDKSTPAAAPQAATPASSTNVTATTANQTGPKTPCLLCNEMHWTNKCTTFPTTQQRKDRAAQLRLCDKCLKSGHQKSNCRSKATCFNCKSAEHATAICPAPRTASNVNAIPLGVRTQPALTTVSNPLKTRGITFEPPETIGPETNQLLLMARHVKAASTDLRTNKTVAAIFDSGGTTTITESLASFLGLPKIRTNTQLATLGCGNNRIKPLYSTQMVISLADKTTIKLKAEVVKEIIPSIYIAQNIPESINQLKNWDPKLNISQEETHILIGLTDYLRLGISENKIRLTDDLVALDSKVGPIICGQFCSTAGMPNQTAAVLLSFTHNAQSDPATLLEQIYELETLGLQSSEPTEMKVHREFCKAIRINSESRYEVPLLFKRDHEPIPDNFAIALNRLKSVARKLHTNPRLLDEYQKTMNFQMQEGIIEQVPCGEKQPTDGRVLHYIPHLPVVKEGSATTKVRIVFDAGARANKTSPALNDILYRGPVILPSLIDVLIRIRSYPIVISADIRKAFLQVSVKPEHRDAMRFLWLKDPTKATTENNLQFLRFKRVTFGLKCSPYLLAATLLVHLEKYNKPSITKRIQENLYVDNMFLRADNEAELKELCSECIQIFDTAKMELRELASNHESLQSSFDREFLSEGANQKLLGIQWNTESDELRFTFPAAPPPPLTRRKVLETIASFYDPLGIFAPCLLLIKSFQQTIHKQNQQATTNANHKNKIDWDPSLSTEQEAEWVRLTSGLLGTTVRIPRFNGTKKETTTTEIHAFADASGYGYGAAVYIRFIDVDLNTESHLVTSKSRVPPAKRKCTLPELELLAILTAAKLVKTTQTALKLASRSIIWSDSLISIQWIKNGAPEKNSFVGNQLKNIRSAGVVEFRHIPGAINVADVLSRGSPPILLKQTSEWWFGPQFLKSSEDLWPHNENVDLRNIPDNKRSEYFHSAALLTVPKEGIKASIVQYQNFSSWTSVIRAIRLLKQKARSWSQERDPTVRETVSMEEARSWIINDCQRISPPSESDIRKFGIHSDQKGTLRCASRLKNSQLATQTINPICLSHKSPICPLIIMHFHEATNHSGVGITLSTLRQEFWITNGRRTTQKAIKAHCFKCRPFFANPFKHPDMPMLPTGRVNRSRPFEHTGTDLFGPFNVKSGHETTQLYGTIFTCFTTRAVHLEIVESANTNDFLNAFDRFIARRGLPTTVFSDNRTNFVSASKILMRKFAPSTNFEWKFNVPLAPWRGGFYERLIKLVKDCLKRTIGRRKFNIIEFQTLLTQIENTINDRPLIAVPDSFDTTATIKPNDFLRPQGLPSEKPAANLDPAESDDPTYSAGQKFWDSRYLEIH